jgi:GH15 family glucan-1,4-alpha-glucosidase
VRIGNAASEQFQLDVYGELFDALHQARLAGLQREAPAWQMQRVLLDFLEDRWRDPDDGIWEVRGGRRHFVHSKVMAWVAFDRAIKAVERFGYHGPVERWRAQREAVRTAVLEQGFDTERNTFVQSFGSRALDGALLLIPLVGFLAPDDPRAAGTVDAIVRELAAGPYVRRYTGEDGLPGTEGSFLACSFWLAEALARTGRADAAADLVEKLLGLANDVGLYSEEIDADSGEFLGNMPQGLTHLALISAATAIRDATQ